MKTLPFSIHPLRLAARAVLAGACLLAASHSAKAAAKPTRIVVLPMFSMDGQNLSDSGIARSHYLTVLGPIENRLVQSGSFEVIDPLATEVGEKEYQRTLGEARSQTSLAVRNLAQKYAADIVYLVDLNVRVHEVEPGFFEALTQVQGRGFDSANRNLGLNLDRTYKHSSEDRGTAVNEVEKEAGRGIARILTDRTEADAAPVSPVEVPTPAATSGLDGITANPPPATAGTGSPIERRAALHEDSVIVRLDGATSPEIAEAFGKILNGALGVVEAKLFSAHLDPGARQASYAVWRLRIDGTEPFRLQANIKKDIDDILKSGSTEYWLRGIPYRYTRDQLSQLKGIYPRTQTTREIQFHVDPDRAENLEIRDRFQ
ncbi:MAG: hypothetical protein AB7J34_14055 [Limisphaerales bacterium]